VPGLDLLSTFVEIYRCGSISAAAERLGLTQPAVSGQLARLEDQLGEQLFVRSRKGVTPTAHAADLAARSSSRCGRRWNRRAPGRRMWGPCASPGRAS
jgi:DNA-binding transcriptional LysR family regulator